MAAYCVFQKDHVQLERNICIIQTASGVKELDDKWITNRMFFLRDMQQYVAYTWNEFRNQ